MAKAANILLTFFNRKKALNQSYSLRALARDLDVSPTFLSDVMRGRKRLAYERLDDLGRVLDLDGESLVALKRSYAPPDLAPMGPQKNFVESSYHYLPRSDFKILKVWYYLAILDLTTCSDSAGTRAEISARLGLHPATTRIAVKELLDAGLLQEKSGRLSKSAERIRLVSAEPHAAIRGFHAEMLEKARAEITKPDAKSREERESIGITFAVDPAKLEIARKMLVEKVHEVAEFLNDGTPTEVYHLCAHLFPLTKR